MRAPAVIFDRDGTLFSVAHHMYVADYFWQEGVDDLNGEWTGEKIVPRSWYDFNASVRFDSPVPVVAGLFRSIRPGVAKLITSGRMDSTRPAMIDSLRKHDLVPDRLLMRRTKDQRRDSVVKLEIYRTLIEPHYDVRYVIDDRPQVVDMWRSIGLPVLAVTDPGVAPLIGAAH